MNDTNFRKQNASRIQEHVLTEDQLKELIESKFKRAYEYHTALNKREEKLAEHD